MGAGSVSLAAGVWGPGRLRCSYGAGPGVRTHHAPSQPWSMCRSGRRHSETVRLKRRAPELLLPVHGQRERHVQPIAGSSLAHDDGHLLRAFLVKVPSHFAERLKGLVTGVGHGREGKPLIVADGALRAAVNVEKELRHDGPRRK